MDHTLVQDYVEELRLRGEKNNLIKDQLRQWRTVAYLSSGWSLHPMVNQNDMCSYLPVRFDEQIHEGDVVFCAAQPGDRFYAHLAWKKVKD